MLERTGTILPKKDVDFFKLDLSDRPVRTALRADLLGILKVDTALFLYQLEDGKRSLVQTANRAKGDATETISYSAEPGVYLFEVRDSKNREANFQDSYQLTVDFHDDGSWSYVSDTMLMVKGRDEPFLHRDHNRLSKIGEPDLNPWAKIVKGAA